MAFGEPERAVAWSYTMLGLAEDPHPNMRSHIVTALTIAGREQDAIAESVGLVDAAEATGNPEVLGMALLSVGFAYRHIDPDHARQTMRRGLTVAFESGNRFIGTHIAANLAQLDLKRGDRAAALDHIGLAIRHLHDSGGVVTLRSPMTNLAILLAQLGHLEAAATLAGFAVSPLTVASFPQITDTIAQLRETLGAQRYAELAEAGATMPIADLVAYAYDQIDAVRARPQPRPQ